MSCYRDEIDRKYQEIMQLSGQLNFGEMGQLQSDQTDLEDLGELGHGTCGQVITMKHKTTGKILAVKVSAFSHDLNIRIVKQLQQFHSVSLHNNRFNLI